MDKESLSNAKGNNGNDWNESMSDIQPSSEIDFKQRKEEMEDRSSEGNRLTYEEMLREGEREREREMEVEELLKRGEF